MSNPDSFIRWAGGKSWFIDEFSRIISGIDIKNYYEPFVGGGAIFFSLPHDRYKHAYLSDINPDLINTYEQIRDNATEVVNCFVQFKNSKEEYYAIRDKQFDTPIERAAQFIFLNQTSFNGIYRVNKQGQYNVPYGYRKSWHYDAERIFETSHKLQGVKLKCCDFTEYKYRIKEQDLVFLDPPYTVSHNNNGFIEYNKKLFSLDDQYRLKEYIDFIKGKGAYYIMTNAAHSVIESIFKAKEDIMIPLDRNSLIGGKQSKRGIIKEYIFTNIPQEVKP